METSSTASKWPGLAYIHNWEGPVPRVENTMVNAIIVLTNDLHDDPLPAWPMSCQKIPLKTSIDFAFF